MDGGGEGGWMVEGGREGGQDRRRAREIEEGRMKGEGGGFAWSLAAAAFPLGLWFAG